MTIDVKGLNDNLLKTAQTYDEFAKKLRDFMIAPAGDITYEYYDANGNLQTVQIPNRNKIVNDFIAKLKSPFRNRIINGDFQIWQRGTAGTGYTNATYTADRWGIFAPTGNITYDWVRASADPDLLQAGFRYGLKLQKTAGTDPLVLNHFIENVAQFIPGEKVAVSFYAKTNTGMSYNIEVAIQGTIGRFVETTPEVVSQPLIVDNSLRRYTVILTVPNYLDVNNLPSFNWGQVENTALILKIRITDPNVLDDFVISGVQLEKGDVATNFEHIPYDVQLARCMRYYEKWEIHYTGNINNPPTNYTNTVYLSTSKRTTPTVVVISATNEAGETGVVGIDYITKQSFRIWNNSWTSTNSYYHFYGYADAEF